MEIQANSYGISERITELIANLKELETAIYTGVSEVDISKVNWATPLSLMPLVIKANKNNIQLTCSEPKSNVQGYLDTISFPNGVTELPRANRSYLPITKLPSRSESAELIEYENRIVSRSGRIGGEDLKFLTTELVTNVKEHSEAFEYWLLAQYYNLPKNRTACEIILADCGIGYKESFMGTEFEVGTDSEAIMNAMAGKSSKSWDEHAYGIRSIADKFVEEYKGKLVIISGDSLVYYKSKISNDISKNDIEVKTLQSYWEGSIVGINFIV